MKLKIQAGHYGSGKYDFASEDSAVIDSFKLTEALKKWTVTQTVSDVRNGRPSCSQNISYGL